MNESARGWDSGTKRVVALILLAALALILYRFRAFLPPLVLAFLLAFILDPIVDFLEARARLSRTAATALVFALVVVILLAAPAVVAPTLVRAVRSLNLDFEQIADDIDRLMAQPLSVLGQELDLRSVYQQLRQTLEAFLRSVAAETFNVVASFFSTLFWLVFILLSAFYLVRDADRIVAWVDSLPPSYLQEDFIRLRQRITNVWHAFLRGQLLMGLLMAAITTTVVTVVGLPNALALGFLAGLMEFVPNVGPIIAAVPAVLVAFFEGSSWLPLSNLWFAALVLGLYLVIQQIEGNVLMPRVLGQSLNLHPLIVLVAIIAGGSLAGVLGMLLAAPTVSTLRVLGEYIYCRLTDRDPFPETISAQPSRVGLGRRLLELVRRQVLAGRWVIRPARAEDRPVVEAICATIWNGEDYIPEVWGEWLADPHGVLVVAELKGRVVGLAKLTRLADDEWWLEGLRVDPAYRRLGVARLLQNHQVKMAERVGRGMLRLGASSRNLPVHRNLDRGGFHRVAQFLYYGADPLPGPCPLRRLASDDLEVLWGSIESSPVFRASAGLYEVSWKWMSLTRQRLAAHLAAGEVWGVDVGDGVAAAILPQSQRAEQLSVGYMDGEPAGLTSLAWGLRVLAGQHGWEGIRVKPPCHSPLLEALEAAGITCAREHELWIFERRLQGENDDGRDAS